MTHATLISYHWQILLLLYLLALYNHLIYFQTTTYFLWFLSEKNMSNRTNFNRTRNNTMPPGRPNQNQSNNFGNNSGPNMIPFDESPEVMFYLLSTLLLPSLLCFLFLLYNLIRLPKLRNKSNNFFIIMLLLINFVHVSFYFNSLLSKISFRSFSY